MHIRAMAGPEVRWRMGMPLATCPSCDEDVLVPGKTKLGATIVCGRCGCQLEVISTNPIELDWASDDLDELDDEEDDEEFDDEDETEGDIDDDEG
jgi:transcription elongation factor Elf1